MVACAILLPLYNILHRLFLTFFETFVAGFHFNQRGNIKFHVGFWRITAHSILAFSLASWNGNHHKIYKRNKKKLLKDVTEVATV